MSEDVRDYLKKMTEAECESPIEAMLYSALIFAVGFDMWERSQPNDPVLPMVTLRTQVECAGFRIDIALTGSHGGARVAIECDGHDFHEKTKEQAARDKSRDRALAAEGWRVIRFTGSEIWKNPFSCADEAMLIVNEMESKAAEVAYLAMKEKGSDTP